MSVRFGSSQGFLVYALPRSRTAWLAHFLSYRGWHSGHDELRQMRSLADCRRWFSQPMTGSVETAAAPWWRLVHKWYPELRTVVIRRPVDEVLESFRRLGVPGDLSVHRAALCAADRKLVQIAHRVPNALAVTFEDLKGEAGCKQVFEHALGLPHDHGWWNALAPVNVQIAFLPLLRYCVAYGDAIAKLAAQATAQIRADLLRPPAPALDSIVFSVEPFDRFYLDAQALLAQHCTVTGHDPEDHRGMNLNLFQALDQQGALQVLTARSNGRMFGYLLTVLSPSLESPTAKLAVHTAFFAEPGINLGLRLQREALARLRAKGCTEVIFREGTKAEESPVALYRRLGAVPYGALHRLKLEN